jgi:mannose-6-phosphate isomerase-like protein (cupin superfamily)
MSKIKVKDEVKRIKKPFHPLHLENVGDSHVYLVLVKGEYKKHRHPSDEFFYVIDGELELELDEGTEKLKKGEGILVKKGKWHKSKSKKKAMVMMFEKTGLDMQFE